MLNLVTGATGFIGSHLVEALVVRGEQVRALVRPTGQSRFLRDLGVDVRVGTLRDNATLVAAAEGVDRFYHCAALVSDWGDEGAFVEANVNGVRNVLAAATRARVAKFIHLSDSVVYGFPNRPVAEDERPSPQGIAYIDSKIEGEALVWAHYRRVGLPVCVLRPASVYGPRSTLLVRHTVELIRRRRLALIDEGRHIAGLTYVGNLVDALILAADSPASVGQAYNVSDGSAVTWREYIHALADICQVPRPTKSHTRSRAMTLATAQERWYHLLGRGERPRLTRLMVETMGSDRLLPIDKAAQQLGYRPRVSFEEGMRYTATWLRREGIVGDGFFSP